MRAYKTRVATSILAQLKDTHLLYTLLRTPQAGLSAETLEQHVHCPFLELTPFNPPAVD